MVAAAAARPLASRAWTFPVLASYTRAKASPPMPVLMGSTTASTAAMATAASAAVPPRRRTSKPAAAARGWLVATAPLRHITTDRREGKAGSEADNHHHPLANDGNRVTVQLNRPGKGSRWTEPRSGRA